MNDQPQSGPSPSAGGLRTGGGPAGPPPLPAWLGRILCDERGPGPSADGIDDELGESHASTNEIGPFLTQPQLRAVLESLSLTPSPRRARRPRASRPRDAHQLAR
jgi:hypothetical protein